MSKEQESEHNHNFKFSHMILTSKGDEAVSFFYCECGKVIRKRSKVDEI